MAKDEEVLIALKRITRAIDLHSKLLLKNFGLSGPQVLVLNEIRKSEAGLSLTQISKKISLSAATVSEIIDRLILKNYVTRTKHEKDKRQNILLVTESGRKILKSIPNLMNDSFLKKFNVLEEWEQNMILANLQRVAEMMNLEKIEASFEKTNLK